MWDFDLMAAIRAIEKSMAYVLYRLGLCLGVAIGYLLATLGGAGTLVGFGSLTKNAISLGPTGSVLGFIAFALLMARTRTLWFRMVDLPQLGILADQWDRREIPSARALLAYATVRKDHAFPHNADLPDLVASTQEVLKDLSRLHPCPKTGSAQGPLARLFGHISVRISSSSYRTVRAWHFMSGHANPWQSVAEALLVVDRHFSEVIRNRMIAIGFTWVGFAAFLPLLDKGIEILVSDIPIRMGFWPLIFAGVFSWALKAAFFDAIAEAAMLGYLFPIFKQEAPQSNDQRLITESPSFAALSKKIERNPV